MEERLRAVQRSRSTSRRPSFVSYNPLAERAAQQQAEGEQQRRASQSDKEKYIEDIFSRVGGNAPKQDEGGGGILGSILNNPVGRGVMKTLEAIDTPRRAVIAGLDEGVDWLNNDDDGRSFGDKVGDSSYGFGDFIEPTGNKWLDRGIGLTGDILLDPTTYVTFGAGKFAGTAGRVSAATRLADAGMDAARVGRLGVLGANEAERAVIFAGMRNADELAQPGLRFMGNRLPGTGQFAETVGRGMAEARAKIGDVMPKALRDLRTPIGEEAAYRTLRSGKGHTNDALALINRGRTARAAEGMFSATYANRAERLHHQIGKEGEDVDRAIFAALDEGLPIPAGLGDESKLLFDDVYDGAAPELPALTKRADFAPHIYMQDAHKAMSGDEWAESRKIIGMDVTEATGGAVKRSIHPGTKITTPDGTVIEFVADTAHGSVSARQINDKLAPVLGVEKVIEDRISRTFQPYIEGMADSVGRAKGLKRLQELADGGAVLHPPLGPGIARVPDEKATKLLAEKRTKEIGRELSASTAETERVARQLTKGGEAVRKDVLRVEEGYRAADQAALTAERKTMERARKVRPALATQRKRVTAEAEATTKAAQGEVEKIAARQAELLKAETAGTITASERKEASDLLNARRDAAVRKMGEAEKKAEKAYASIDAAREASAKRYLEAKDNIADLQRDIKNSNIRIGKLKTMSVKGGRKKDAAAFAKLEKELDAIVGAVVKGHLDPMTGTLMSWYAKGVSEMHDGELLNSGLVALQKAVKSGHIKPVMQNVIQDGYERIGVSLLGEADAPIVRKELARQLQNLDVAMNDSAFFRVIDKYTQFFKTWATATVGFHVRNGMSAAFMNAADGVSVRNMQRGMKLWETFTRDPENFLKNLPSWIDEAQATEALKAVFASGGGAGQFGKAELRLGNSKLMNNAYTRFSQKMGGRVEGFARMGMALDSVLAGEGWEAASGRITRIHFDYSQVSKFDKTMKRIIPFWTFMSRNVPLQLQQMFLKPRLYQHYHSLARNMGQDYEDSMVPLSWQEAGAFEVTDGVWAAPDLPFTRLESDISKLTSDPQRLLADANPLFKIPFETMIADKQLFTDRPFKDNGFEAVSGSGLEVLGPLLEAAGLAERAGNGELVIDEKLGHAARGLVPVVGQVQRMFGGNDYYDDKLAQSRLNWAGIPVRQLTPGQQKREKERRERERKALSEDEARMKALANWNG